jgi:DNA-binding LacI/PurR family transcriptional regulator
MGYLQKGKARGEGSAIGVLTNYSEQELRTHPYVSPMVRGMEARCAQLGYAPAFFPLGKGMGLRRVAGILRARGIQGLVILPFRESTFQLDDFDFAPFSAATIGYGMQSPLLHRSASQQTLAAMRLVEHVLEKGYKRIGLALPLDSDARTQHRYLAGFLGRTVGPDGRAFIPPFLFEKFDPAALAAWIRRHRIDAIVSSFHELAGELEQLGMLPGRDIGLAMINYRGERPLARMQVPYESLGAAAVNLVHGQLSINECGIPQLPSVLTIPVIWVDGPSLPPARSK